MSGLLLVTGAKGFVGSHLVKAFEAKPFAGMDQIMALPSGLDVRNAEDVSRFIAEHRPQAVIHLAAQSFVPRAIAEPRETYEINVIGTLNLIEALAAIDFDGRFLYVSSGDVYGRVDERSLPVTEATIPRPGNPYASSKLAAEELCLQWGRRTESKVLIARPFNHIGPGQSDRFVVSSLATQVTAICQGVKPAVIEVGDIEATRDFTDVRDVVQAYAGIMAKGETEARYIVASGVERPVAQILRQMLEIAGVEAEIKVDKRRMRQSEQRRMFADSARIASDTGWSPVIPFNQTLNDILKSVR